MNKTVYILENDQTGHYLSNSLKSLTNKEQLADQYETEEDAKKALLRSRINTATSILKVSFNVEQESVCYLEDTEIVLLRNSHLDATHVGQKGNPYFYYCDEVANKDYCFNHESGTWEICSWSDYPEETGIKPRSQADEFIKINYEQ